MIHQQAIIDPKAQIADGVFIGPFTVIGPDVVIDQGTWIGPHVVINGPTKIGKNNQIFQFASVGEIPQDKKYSGEATRLEIGDDNVIRENVTISRGTVQDAGVTTIGNSNLLMASVHIAHDCHVANHTIFSNSTAVAGHVTVEDYVIFGGFTLVHQFCSIGAHSFSAMNSVISKDVPPFVRVSGHMAKPFGLNTVGLERSGFTADALLQLRKAYKILYRSGNTLEKACVELADLAKNSIEVEQLIKFVKTSTRGIVR